MPPAPDAPLEHEEPVGAALSRLRRSRGLSGAALAALVGMSQPKISRLERGIGIPDPADVGAVARALGADEPAVLALVARAERSHDRMTDWRPEAGGLASRQISVGKWETSARVIRIFDPAAVPGLLQSSGYARAMLRGFQHLLEVPAPSANKAARSPAATEAAVLAAVAERIRRQRILTDRTKSFRIVLAEAVLGYAICPPAEMLAQIGRLREISDQENVDLRFIVTGSTVVIPPIHGFVMIDDRMVVIDAFNTGLISRSRKDAESYRRVFAMFEDDAVPAGPTLDKYENYYIGLLRPGTSR